MGKKSFEISCESILHDDYFRYAKTPGALEEKLIEFRAQYEIIPPDFRINKIHDLTVCFYLPFKIKINQVGGVYPKRLFEIRSGNRIGRFTEGSSLMVVPGEDDDLTISINIYAKGERFRRIREFTWSGVCWVEQGENNSMAKAHLVLDDYHEHSWEYGDIVKTIKQARKQAIKMIKKVLNSKEKIPLKEE